MGKIAVLSRRRITAMEAALVAMMAGEQGEGDWPDDIRASDLEGALTWVHKRMHKMGMTLTEEEGA